MQEEEAELTEAFRSSLSVNHGEGAKNTKLVAEIDNSKVGVEREATLRRYKFDQFVAKNFSSASPHQFTLEPLLQPLLAKNSDITKQVRYAEQLLVAIGTVTSLNR